MNSLSAISMLIGAAALIACWRWPTRWAVVYVLIALSLAILLAGVWLELPDR